MTCRHFFAKTNQKSGKTRAFASMELTVKENEFRELYHCFDLFLVNKYENRSKF